MVVCGRITESSWSIWEQVCSDKIWNMVINDDDTDEKDGGDDDDKAFYSEHNRENSASFGLILAIDKIYSAPVLLKV